MLRNKMISEGDGTNIMIVPKWGGNFPKKGAKGYGWVQH